MPERETSHDNQQCTPKRSNDRYILKKENMQQQNEILKGKTKVLSTDSQKNIKKTEDQNYQTIYLLKKIYAHEEKAKVNNI